MSAVPARAGGATFEVIVVDDHSTDRTREIAIRRRLATAKGYAHRSTNHRSRPAPRRLDRQEQRRHRRIPSARGEWLLFTDADTIHAPGSLARSLEEAKAMAQPCSHIRPANREELWEKSVMPVIFAELASSFRPSK
jgi:glycosyltransferase involved in cell wall biosynthesis